MTLRVTLEIVPFGVEDEKRVIHTLNISNLGVINNTDGLYRYGVEVDKYKTQDYDIIVNHDRSMGALHLVSAALNDLLYPEGGQN